MGYVFIQNNMLYNVFFTCIIYVWGLYFNILYLMNMK